MKHSSRIRIYKILILIFVIGAFLWPNIINKDAEIDNRALAISIGIDVNNDDDRGAVLATAQILAPVPQGQAAGKQEVVSGTGHTLAEALNYINVKLGRILDLGQCGVVIFGREKAKEGILNEIKYLVSGSIVRPEVTLFVASENTARDLMKKTNSLTEEATSSLNNFLKFNAQGMYMPNISMLEFLAESSCESGAACIPILNVAPQEVKTLVDGSEKKEIKKEAKSGGESGGEGNNQNSGDEGNSEGGGESGGPINEIKDIDRAYLFKGGKAIAELNNKETRALVWRDEDTHLGLLMLDNVHLDGHVIRDIPCELRNKRVKYRAGFEKGRPVITFKLVLYLNAIDLHKINEIFDMSRSFSRSDVNNALKTAVKERVMEDVEVCMQKLRELDADALQIKQEFFKFRYREYKKYIEKNPDFLQRVEVKYDFIIRIY